ncbi:MAM and LDL-receptor class A domain-containing protein 1-like [Diadema antillarum]|uniref:MAM and LDL-receptor class A domain-containing protein 1-like n=1 Tax=Diadema antillarum TaxID=105358 RepID=UPI003A8656B5
MATNLLALVLLLTVSHCWSSNVDCDFESGLCGWLQLTDDDFDWTRENGGTPSSSTGPSGDHTTGNGYYMYIETSSPRFAGEVAILKSPPDMADTCCTCLTFWYHMYGDTVNSLNVYKSVPPTDTGKELIFSRSNTSSDSWLEAQVFISGRTLPTYIYMEGVCGNSYTGDIAIDDIVISEGGCSGPAQDIDCNFDYGVCGWEQETDDDFDWSRNNGSTSSYDTGPSGDHTTGYGSYMYIETSSPRSDGDVARLRSPAYLANNTYDPYCLTFWYHMYGNTISTLNVMIADAMGDSTYQLYSMYGQRGDMWQRAKVNFDSYFLLFNIIMEGVCGSSYTGDIAVDDISLSSGYCQYVICDGNSFQCSNDECIPASWRCDGWSDCSDGSDEFGCAGGLSVSTTPGAPRVDGVRLMGAQSGEGRVEVFVNNQWGTVCDDNWDINDANVICKMLGYSSATSAPRMAYFGQGNGPIWMDEVACSGSETDLNQCAHNGFGSHDCSHSEDAGVFCDISNAQNIDCNFEYGVCGWEQETDDDFDWSRNNGSTSSYDTGPSGDHTTGYGSYMYIETSSPRSYGDIARLRSPAYFSANTNQTYCLNFWYHMYGDTISTLNVKMADAMANSTVMLYTLYGEQGDMWNEARLDVYSYYQLFNIIMEGIRGSSYTGDIAIDDISLQSGSCPPQGQDIDCDFEYGVCGWVQETDDDFDWSRNNGSTPSLDTGPSGDHTTGYGNYMYIETSPRSDGDVARLRSPAYLANNTNEPYCLTFWYHMYGNTINTLNVIMADTMGYSTYTLYSMYGERGDMWQRAKVDVYSYFQLFNIIMEGVRGSSYTGDIAVDDISLSSGFCLYAICDGNSFQCSNDECIPASWRCDGWSDCSDGSDEFGCAGGLSVSTTPGTPRVDGVRLMGAQSGEGRVEVFVNNQWGTVCDDNWDINDANVICKMLGYSSATSAPRMAYFGQGNGPIWMDEVACSGSETDLNQCAHNGFGSHDCSHSEDAGVFCDISNAQNIDCNFEYGVCGWEQETDDDFDWSRNNGSTSSYDTGPSGDHTTGYGSYMYIETSSPRSYGDIARLRSPAYFSANTYQTYCLNFWYHMYGDTISTLNVKMADAMANSTVMLYTLYGEQGDMWNEARLDVYSYYQLFNIIMEGIRGSSYTGDIAIDDISLQSGSCPPQGQDIDCDFEYGVCGWVQETDDDFDWSRNNGSTPSLDTGPSGDHTTGYGSYMYIETSSPRSYGDIARLRSPAYFSANTYQTYCLNFWYHMYGDTISTLNVKMADAMANSTVMLYTLYGEQGDMWNEARLDVYSYYQLFNIIMEGIRGSSYTGDIAIDDISLQSGSCPPQGQDIDCDFEYGVCGWVQETDDDFDWSRNNGSTPSLDTGPSGDHTTGYGNYMYIETSPRSDGDVARLRSPAYLANNTNEPYCLTFWYHMYGNTINTLNVIMADTMGYSTYTLYSMYGEQGDMWQRAKSLILQSDPVSKKILLTE